MTEAQRTQRLAYWRERVWSHVGRDADADTVLETVAAWLVAAHFDIEQWQHRARQAGYREPALTIESRRTVDAQGEAAL